MTIPLIKEPEGFAEHFHGVVEKCCFCGNRTKYWHKNTNNPVCKKCARLHKVKELHNYLKPKKGE